MVSASTASSGGAELSGFQLDTMSIGFGSRVKYYQFYISYQNKEFYTISLTWRTTLIWGKFHPKQPVSDTL